MLVASLMGSDGCDKPLEEVMATAKAKLRYVTFSSMGASDFDVSGGGGRTHDKYAKSVQCKPRDIDLFISHSWSDGHAEKWEALSAASISMLRCWEPTGISSARQIAMAPLGSV